LPPAVVYGLPTTSYSPVSSVSRSPTLSCIGKTRSVVDVSVWPPSNSVAVSP
jgi:hypothetical protein